MEKLLKKLGLEEKEIAIYLACLQHEPNNPANLARLTGIRRSTVYFYLEKLQKRGLISRIIKGKRQLITATPPTEAFREFLNQEEEKIVQDKNVIEKLIPALTQAIKHKTPSTQVTYYEGKAGARAIIDKLIKENKDNYWFGSLDTFFPIMKAEEVYRRLTLKRIKQSTTAYAITDRRILAHKRFSETLGNYRKFRFLKENINIPAGIQLFGDNIAIASIEGESLKVVLIEDPAMAQILCFIFMTLWNSLPEE
ncbi:MAG: helix-turn-helix domain-containing protein [Patescibacteria group bacterium]|jgi:sugar-specific transcriptional regulator TrmB